MGDVVNPSSITVGAWTAVSAENNCVFPTGVMTPVRSAVAASSA